MSHNLGSPAGAEPDVPLSTYPLDTKKNIASNLATRGGGQQPSVQSQLDRLKELQRLYSRGQHLSPADTPAVGFGIGQHHGSGGSVPLVPPGPSSPHDSQAPASRCDGDGVTNVSNGSDPMSRQAGGSFGRPFPGTTTAVALEELAIPDFSDLPLGIPDFGDLDVPSLEDLVQNIGTAEAELVATRGLATRLGLHTAPAGGDSGNNLLRSHTLPVPSTVPRSKPVSRTRNKPQVRKDSTDARRGSSPAEGGLRQQQQQQAASGSDGSGGSGAAQRKRKSASETQAEVQQQPAAAATESDASPFAAVALAATTPNGWDSNAGSEDLNKLSRHPSKKIEVDFILDDDALLNRVMVDTSPFARPKPKNDRSLNLAHAASLPNAHWLSPAAAIHAVHASRPGDEDVIRWLLHGK